MLPLGVWVALVACVGERESVPSPHQGVVELDTRVLAFEVGGRLVTVDVERGQRVTKGQPIARLDDALVAPTRAARVAEIDALRAQLALAEAGARPDDLAAIESQVKALTANERTAKALLTRQEALVKESAAPVATLDELRGRVVSLRHQRDGLEHQLAAAREGARPQELQALRARITGLEAALAADDLRADKLALTSPADGVILDRIADPGEVVAPGAPIVTLGDRDHPYVDVFVAIVSLAPLDVGQAAEVLVDGLPPMRASIEHIADHTEFTPRYVFSKQERPHLVSRVRLRLDDPEHHLHPGLPAFARFAADGVP